MSLDNGDNHTFGEGNPDLQAPDEFSKFGFSYLSLSGSLRRFFCREFLFDRALFLFERLGTVPMTLMYYSGKNFLSEVEQWEKRRHEKSLRDTDAVRAKRREANSAAALVISRKKRIKKEVEECVISEKLGSLLTARGVEKSEQLKSSRLKPATMLARIEDIENRGIIFSKELWNLILLPDAERNKKIELLLVQRNRSVQEPRDVIRHTRASVNALSNVPPHKKEKRILHNIALPPQIKALFGDDNELRGYIVKTPPSNVTLTEQEKELLSRGSFVACIFYVPSRGVHIVIERKFILRID